MTMSFPKQKPKEGNYPNDLACTLGGSGKTLRQ